MDIDIERLKVDREYWDCVALEDATHMNPSEPSARWWRQDGQCFYMWDSGKWVERLYWPKRLIHRPPEKAQEVEWDGEAFPIPTGAKCEVQMGSFWYPGTVIASTAEAAWFKADERGEFWTIMNGLSIRPIRTKEQRLRDELAKVIAKAATMKLAVMLEPGHYEILADSIIAEGWTKEQSQ